MAQFNLEGLVRLQTYMAGKTLSDSQATAVVSADVVEMQDAAESNTRRRYYRIAEDDESITFSCILGSSQQQLVLTKATKQLSVTTTELGGAITPGSITTDMLTDGAVTGSKIAVGAITAQNLTDSAITTAKLADGAITTSKLADGAVTSEKLAAGLDVSGLFFILPDGTQFPYTLTEEDKAKLENVRFLIVSSVGGSKLVVNHPYTSGYAGVWFGASDQSNFAAVTVSATSISAPTTQRLIQTTAISYTRQALTAEQKTQARTNIGAAEDPNTSGDSQATLEEPPIIDEEPIS